MSTKHGSACIAYISSKGTDHLRSAIFWIPGDMPREKFADVAWNSRRLALWPKLAQRLANRYGVRVVRLSRLGLEGSSGDHARRGRPNEMHILNAAVDSLKQRFGIDDIAVVGQSRGSTIWAGILTLGRRDVRCAALGSGVFEVVRWTHEGHKAKGRNLTQESIARRVYDPSRHIAGIVSDPKRRILIIGDPDDSRTPFDQQERFANTLTAAGHHVLLVPIVATDEKSHGATPYALEAAGMCMTDRSDKQISARLKRMRMRAMKRLELKGRSTPSAPADRSSPPPAAPADPLPYKPRSQQRTDLSPTSRSSPQGRHLRKARRTILQPPRPA